MQPFVWYGPGMLKAYWLAGEASPQIFAIFDNNCNSTCVQDMEAGEKIDKAKCAIWDNNKKHSSRELKI